MSAWPLGERKPEVLFVDDEPDNLASIRRLLRLAGSPWNATYVNSVDEALQQICSTAVDVVVSDIYMPGKTGFDLLRCLRRQESPCDLPVLIITGSAQTVLKREALDLGATDLLYKPVHSEDLIVRVNNMLRIKFQQDQLKEQNRRLDEKVKERTSELENLHIDLIWRLARIAECRDRNTGNHILRVAHYCRLLAVNSGQDPHWCERIFLASPLHDIGKIGIPDRVLLKAGKLDREERQAINKHCLIGVELLHHDLIGPSAPDACCDTTSVRRQYPNPVLDLAAEIALHHHERWDGGGYPSGLKGQDIPLSARICAIADVFDALSTNRPYKKAFPEQTVIEMMTVAKGKHFDPDLFEVFLNSLPEFRTIRARLMD